MTVGIDPGKLKGQSEQLSGGMVGGYVLPLRQMWGATKLGWLFILCVTFLGCAFAVWDRGFASWWAWMGDWGIWLLVPPVVWVMTVCAFGIWRFLAEIADPSYPTPRSASNPDYQREGPHWPWMREPKLEPALPEPPTPSPAPEWTIGFRVTSENGRSDIYGKFSIPNPQRWHRYADAWRYANHPAWSVTGFASCGLTVEEYRTITGEFEKAGGLDVTKEYRDGRKEYTPNAVGMGLLSEFALTPPQ